MDLPEIGDGYNEAAGPEFIEQSYLNYIVPFVTAFDPSTGLRPDKPFSVEQREVLFFGMPS